MRMISRILRVNGIVLISLFLLTLAIQGCTRVMLSCTSVEGGGGDQDGAGVNCNYNKHTANPNGSERAQDGTACTSGYVCNAPPASLPCGFANAGSCTTVHQGGGKCQCACLMN